MPSHPSALAGLAHRAEEIYAVARTRRGFTLLELCMVLFILTLLAGAAMPAMKSAFTEQELRTDAHQFSLMVKTGMIQSAEQNRPYVLDLAVNTISLQPVVPAIASETAPPAAFAFHANSDPEPAPVLEDVTMDLKLTNKFQLPDAKKKDAWEAVASERWTFQPSGLCPLPRVRLSRGQAWIEMDFNALTGNVENEAAYIP